MWAAAARARTGDRARAADRIPLAIASAELRQAGSRASADLRTVFSWSYNAVSPDAARLFRLLGLTAGADIAADAVAALAGTREVRATLGELIDAGLLTEHRPGRYLLHDLVRDYAGELARGSDCADERRHALTRLLDFYTRTAHEADRVLNPARAPILMPLDESEPGRRRDFRSAVAWLDAERSVLLATLRQAREEGLDRHAWQLGWALDTFLFEQHHLHDEGAAWAVALQAAISLVDQPAAAHAHRFLGAVAGRLSRFTDAYAHMNESLRLCRAEGDRLGEAETEFVLSYVSWLQADHRKALEHAERSLRRWSALDDPGWEGRAGAAVGWYHLQLGDYSAAVPFFQRAILLQRQAGDGVNEVLARGGLGCAYLGLGAGAAAAEQFDTARTVAVGLGDPILIAQVTDHLGNAHEALGDHTAARERWEYAYKLLANAGHPQAGDVANKLAASPQP